METSWLTKQEVKDSSFLLSYFNFIYKNILMVLNIKGVYSPRREPSLGFKGYEKENSLAITIIFFIHVGIL